MNLSETYKNRLRELAGVTSNKSETFYHQTDKRAAKNIMKNGFSTSEVWAAPDDNACYGDYVVAISSPVPKKPFILDIDMFYDYNSTNISRKKLKSLFEIWKDLIEKNHKLYQDLGGEVNPQTFEELRKIGYDVIIEENGDRCFLYPKTLKVEEIYNPQ